MKSIDLSIVIVNYKTPKLTHDCIASIYKNSNGFEYEIIVVDNKSQGDLKKIDGMNEIIESEYTDFIEGNFEDKAERIFQMYGHFDFVWLDCGSQREYTNFFKEYWQYCSNYIFFHFTYLNGIPNIKHKVIQDNLRQNSFMFDIVEPHKKRQGSITMIKKKYL